MELETIDYEVSDGVGHVRLARPAGANAVNPQFSSDLRDVMLEIEWDDDVKAVSLQQRAKSFAPAET
jgi:2-(1,2-epoxy-1,2-dihydrophenyl)acetyl-CoA isomerase